MRYLLYIFLLFSVLPMFVGCSAESKEQAGEGDSIELPNMVTSDVNMLISDSGVIKYKAIAPLWYVYENDVRNKYWYFPEGIRLDQIDTTFATEFSIESDTAYNYETKQLWHLIKNVKIRNTMGEYFETNDLYWDMRNHKVYSDSFIHIERPDAIIEGFGFTSDDAFTKYEIRQTSGIFPFQEDAMGSARQDSTSSNMAADSIAGTNEPRIDFKNNKSDENTGDKSKGLINQDE